MNDLKDAKEKITKTMSLLEKILEAHKNGTAEEKKALEPEMVAYLVETRDSLPEGSSSRHLINFHFAAQALHGSLIAERKLMSAQALMSFIPQFVKVCAIDSWLMRDGELYQEKEDAPGS